MGETGIGKTAILNYLANVIDADFSTLNVHAGITEK
jgi:MoxR-like ATPase